MWKFDWEKEKPPMICSGICDIYSNADKGICNSCPFYIECPPYFEHIAGILEIILGDKDVKSK